MFLNPTDVKELKDEFPIYIASTKDITTEIGPKDAFRWWRMQSNSLPKWSKFTKKIACVQPTSAAAERMLKGLYDDTQSCVLEDHRHQH